MLRTDNSDGGPALPITAGNQVYAQGMSLRDWFASQAEVAVAYDLLHREGCEELVGEPMPEGMSGLVRWRLKVVAKLKYMQADAMLAARDL